MDYKAISLDFFPLEERLQSQIKYIESVTKSFRTAESGFAFAKLAQELCDTLSGGRDECPDELIQESIAEMKEIAKKAHKDAKVTAEMFNATSQVFTEIRADVSKTSKAIEAERIQAVESKAKAESRANLSQDVPVIGSIVAKGFNSKAKTNETKAMLYEQALEYLESAAKDLERLKEQMNTVTDYWNGIETELYYLDTQAKKLRDDNRLQLKITSFMRNWKGVEKDFRQYINALNTLLNNNPQYNDFLALKPLPN